MADSSLVLAVAVAASWIVFARFVFLNLSGKKKGFD
jgi:hypothetical protein